MQSLTDLLVLFGPPLLGASLGLLVFSAVIWVLDPAWSHFLVRLIRLHRLR